MGTIRELRVNVVPKLDIRKARMVSEQMGSLFSVVGKALDGFMPALSSFVKIADAAVIAFDALVASTNRPAALVRQATKLGSNIGHITDLMGGDPARLDQMVSALATGGASETAVLALMQKFGMKANENNIQGDFYEKFIEILAKIDKEQNNTKKRKMVDQYFGIDQISWVNNVKKAAANWDTLRHNVPIDHEKSKAISNSQRVSLENADIPYRATRGRLFMVEEQQLFDINSKLMQESEEAETKLLATVEKDPFISLQSIAIEITSGLDQLVQHGINNGTKLADVIKSLDNLRKTIDSRLNERQRSIPSNDKSL